MDPLRIGFLGAGTVARLHAAAVEATPGVTLAAVYDPAANRAAELAAAYGAVHAPDAAALLDHDGIDAVFVLTPTATHLDLAHRCLDRGRHVLVEKPVAEHPAAIRELAEHARRAGLTAVPGHNYLYLPECARLVRYARAGRLGRVRALFVTYAIAHPEALAAQYGGVLAEVMVHHAYLALAVLGPPDRVHGGTCAPGWETLTTDDQAWMTWEYDTGSVAQLFASFAVDDLSADPATFAVKALGTRGSAATSWRTTATVDDGPFRVGMPLYEETYQHQCAAFRDTVQAGAAPLSTLDDAAHVAGIIAALGA
jgi:myo-inositol 2-dehydrogenase / D-chiro-inositol 1-dehydrogenase